MGLGEGSVSVTLGWLDWQDNLCKSVALAPLGPGELPLVALEAEEIANPKPQSKQMWHLTS